MNEGNNAPKRAVDRLPRAHLGRAIAGRRWRRAIGREAAKRGNTVAAKIVLDRLAPPRRSRPIQFDLPPIADTAGLIAAFAALTSGVADGTLTPDEAASVATLLEAQRKVIETHGLSVRIAAPENLDETA